MIVLANAAEDRKREGELDGALLKLRLDSSTLPPLCGASTKE